MDTLTDTDLDWAVIVEGESAEEFSCERAGECDRAAVYKVLWMPEEVGDSPCTCGPHSYLICLTCFDLLTRHLDGFVWCVGCSATGPMQFKSIVHSEPIRRHG